MKKNIPSNNDPIGLHLDPSLKRWIVGPLLGSGACGTVHSVQLSSSSSSSKNQPVFEDDRYAVKIAPLSNSSLTANTKRKKKKTDMERNADLLHHE